MTFCPIITCNTWGQSFYKIVHCDFLSYMFCQNAKFKLWLFVLWLFDCDFLSCDFLSYIRLKAQPCRLLLNQYERYNLIRTVQTSNTHVNKAVHYAQVLNSQCQEDITRISLLYRYNNSGTRVCVVHLQ